MAKIVIDPGHGGTDGGASGNGIVEKDLTLQISQYMYDKFDKLGIPVSITRTTDETLSPTERVERILAPYGNESDVIVISNHINAGGGDGAEVIYALRNNGKLANTVLEEIRLTGQNVRKAYQRRLPSDTSKDYYFIHRNTGITEPIIVEYGFLDSTSDDVSQLKNNWREYADAVVRGVSEYIGVAYDEEVEGVYIVKSGDSLYSIANRYNTTVNELKNLNNLTSNTLRIGQKLIVPTSESEEIEQDGVYTVKSGDSLYSIARQNNTTIKELIDLNNLTTTNLSIGQKLKLPSATEEEIETNEYIVKSGDTLYKIANQYDLSVADLINVNNLTTNTLTIGQKLIIPMSNQEEVDTSYQNYTVTKGDNLYAIAREYNTTVDNLMKINNLKSNLLSIGQVIKVPTTSSTTGNTYTVQSGDTLYSIARKFGKTVTDIQNKNNLSGTNLSIGQVLKI